MPRRPSVKKLNTPPSFFHAAHVIFPGPSLMWIFEPWPLASMSALNHNIRLRMKIKTLKKLLYKESTGKNPTNTHVEIDEGPEPDVLSAASAWAGAVISEVQSVIVVSREPFLVVERFSHIINQDIINCIIHTPKNLFYPSLFYFRFAPKYAILMLSLVVSHLSFNSIQNRSPFWYL